jgi:uncharacterized membrane protein YbhN (UPF0104 family)
LASDAASALTPYRLGGDAARVAGLARYGVPPRRTVAALLGEAVQNWPVIGALGLALVLMGGGSLGVIAGAVAERVAARLGPWMPVVAGAAVLLLGLAVWAGRRLREWMMGPGSDAGVDAAVRPTAATLFATLPLTVVSIVARVLILPVLAAGHGFAAAWAPLTLASFALLHSQLLLPTPSGAGAVDLGFAVTLGGAGGVLLLSWRFYTSVIAVLLGAPAALLLRTREVR